MKGVLDPFAPMESDECSPAAPALADDGWRLSMPAPPNAPEITRIMASAFAPPGYGYTAHWRYNDAQGRLLGFVVRCDRPANGAPARKQFRPITLWEGPGGQLEWRARGFPEPRPLYGLDKLAARPDAPVVVCEGEKAADAAGKLFPERVAVASPNGAQSARKADWRSLRGRRVTVWPDADESGARYAADVAELAGQAGVASVALVPLPPGLPDGWDLADESPARLDLAGLLAEAAPMPAHAAEPARVTVTLTSAADIRPVPVQWLWPGWLASGKLHVLGGQPGTGKTTIALALAAVVSRGGAWPDGNWSPVGNVVIWSGEDDPADTLLPRLLAAGADRARLFFVEGVQDGNGRRPFDPANDMGALRDKLATLANVRLIVVDPIVSAVAGDSHKNAETRRGLAPLVDLASGLGAALVGITHFTKGTAGREPVERITGSLAFGALARVVMIAAKEPDGLDGAGRRIFARAKSNIGPDDGGFAYALNQVPMPDDGRIVASVATFGERIEGSARDMLAAAEAVPEAEDGDGGALRDAKDFLRRELSGGAVPFPVLLVAAREAGQAWATVRRAKQALGVAARKNGMEGGWAWSLPEGVHETRRCSPHIV